jgi:hypothetical protein
MLVRWDDGTIDIVEGPVELALAIGLLLKGVQHPLEHARFAPAVEAARHGPPRPIALGQIPPGGAGAQDPEDAIEAAAMVTSGSPRRRFLGWEQRLELLP